mgnify:CR=1 FL=1
MIVKKKDARMGLICLLLGIILFLWTNSFSDSILSSMLRVVSCALFLWCIYMGRKETFILNPFWLFSLTPLSLLLYNDNVSRIYLQKLTSKTWGLAILNIIAFSMTLFISLKIMRRKKGIVANEQPDKIACLKQNSVIMMGISFIPVLYRMLFGKVMMFTSVISLCVYVSIIMGIKTKEKRWIIGILLIAALRFLFAFNKTELIFFLIVIVTGIEKYYELSSKSKIKILFGLGVSALFMLFVAFPLKTYVQDNGGNIVDFFTKNVKVVYDYGQRIDWSGPEVLKMPYMYLVTAWNNVQYVLETQNTRTYGLWFVKPILGYFQLSGLFDSLYELKPYSSFNTYTYITVLFKDFGYFGSAIGSFFLGWFVAKMYYWYTVSQDSWKVSCYSLTAIAVFEMFFSNHFFGLSYPFTIVLLYFVFEKCFRVKG